MDGNQLIRDFKEVKMSDVEFSKHLKKEGWEGDYNPIANFQQFIHPDGTILALVKYRNEYPVNRWIYLPEDI